MAFIDSTKSIIENLYYISGVLLFFSIIVAIRQLFFAKKSLDINSRREAAKFATQQVDIYNSMITDLQNTLEKIKEEKKIKSPIVEQKEFSLKYILSEMDIFNVVDAMDKNEPILPQLLDVLNAMESFSIYFIQGVADEEIAFSSVGGAFVDVVDRLYFDISVCNDNENGSHFQNLIKLHKLWKSRLVRCGITNDYQRISKNLKGKASEKIIPIGVKKNCP